MQGRMKMNLQLVLLAGLLFLQGCDWLNDDVNGTKSSAESKNIDHNKTLTINGHVLPPEPDSKINNATLLGIDVNNNGVRDNVERWIYVTYKDKHCYTGGSVY